jgi:anthranilate synthase component 2
MGVVHREHPIYGIQFHPESIGTPAGVRILRNFLESRAAG